MDGVSRTTPFTIDAAIGFQFQLEAPDQTAARYAVRVLELVRRRGQGSRPDDRHQRPDATATFQPPPDTTAAGGDDYRSGGSGATVSGDDDPLTATATDAVGVAGVQFLLDGVALGAEDTTSPYSVSWNTTTAANGPHTLTARARDAAGNTTTSAVVAVTVSQPAVDPTLASPMASTRPRGPWRRTGRPTPTTPPSRPGRWVAGRFGNGLGLNGTTTRAVGGQQRGDLSGPFTIEAWVLNAANGAYETIATDRVEPGPLPRAAE